MSDQRELYRREVGPDALARQEQAKLERHACCWEPLTGPHHLSCPKYEPPETHIDAGQESLL